MARQSKSKPAAEKPAPLDPPPHMPARRKLIAFDEETWQALDVFGRDSLRSIQELADEAFDDLLKKHGRPVGLRAALKQSAKLAPPDTTAGPAGRRR